MSKPTEVRRSPNGARWIIAMLFGVSLFLGFFVLPDTEALAHTTWVQWWTIALGFALAETWVVHLHFRSETGSFSLFEVPLVLGLVYLDPQLLWLATLLGPTVALVVVRRQPMIKVLFNAANLSLDAGIAAVLVHWLAGPDILAPISWVAIAVATMMATAVQIGSLAAVIVTTEGIVRRKQVLSMLATASVVAVANTSLALVAALLIKAEPVSILLLTAPVIVLVIAYRAYVAERNQREQVEFLYASTKALRETPETTSAAASLLEEVVSMFRAERAILFLLPSDDAASDKMATTCYSFVNGGSFAHIIDDEVVISELVEFGRKPNITPSPAATHLASFLDSEGIDTAMIGTLLGTNRDVGVLIVANRLGNVMSFTLEDLRLFGTLLEHAAVALENDQLEQALNEMRRLERRLAHQAHHDGLTGLMNRTMFASTLAAACNENRPVSVLYVDLDDFKVVNDSLGHEAGDFVLNEVANRIRSLIRPNDLPARLGGDEFAILLDTGDQARLVGRRLIQSLHEPIYFADHDIRIGASVGLAHASGTETDPELLLNDADIAMYAAKSKGKGALVEFEPAMRVELSKRRVLRTELRQAIESDEFEIVYQPIVEPSTGDPVGAEALVRWNREGHVRMPDEFIGEAERGGMIVAIDRTVLTKVVHALGDMPDDRPGFISLNLSARNFLEDDLTDLFAQTLAVARLRSDRLVVEITETALIRDPPGTIRQLAALRELGIRVALDDFGTGYSSLSYLRRLPVDILKIAAPFIADIEQDDSFVRTIIDLGRNLGLTIVAEGVESEGQRRKLQELGCDLAQGFLFSRPLPRDQFFHWKYQPDPEVRPLSE